MAEKKSTASSFSVWGQSHITFAKYALIEIGMTREEVEKIITRDGSDIGEPFIADEIEKLLGKPYTEFSIVYRQGTAYARITYKDKAPSRVVSKMQLGPPLNQRNCHITGNR